MLCSATVASAGPWCSGQTCQPVTLEIAGSNPVGPATSRFGGYDGAVRVQGPGRVAAVAAVTLLAGCVNASPSLVPSTPGANGTTTPQPTPTGTPIPDVSFPLAVVTGITNLKATIGLDELGTLASGGELVVPCGVTVDQPELTATAHCVAADQIVAEIQADQTLVALLPPGLVEPATKVLSIAGEGPFGLFGPDLFGDPEARALPYPVMGSAPADGPDPSTRPGPHTTPPRFGT